MGGRTALGLFLLVLVAVGSGVADSNFTLTGAGPNNLGGVYVAPYTGQLASGVSSALGTGTLTLICDDYFDDVSVWQQWNVQVTAFSSGDLSNTIYSSGTTYNNFGPGTTNPATTAADFYKELFYLIDQMNLSSTDSTVLQKNADLNWAIWELADPGLVLGTSDQSTIAGYASAAEANYNLVTNADDFYIISPSPTDKGAEGQEYITYVPEPSSLALFGSGLLTLLWRRKLC